MVDLPAESRAVAEFLRSAETRPSVLVIEGEAGMGKTTLWRQAVAQASERHFRVLTVRADGARSGIAYAALTDLLDGVDTALLDTLPQVQRVALDRVLHRRDDHTDGPPTDERVVASAFLTIADQLTPRSPVLVAIDDVQWLDPSSRSVVAFGVRRLRGRIGILVAERTDAGGHDTGWLRMLGLDGVRRIRVGPLGMTGLRSAVAEHLGHRLSPVAMTRIAELSGGNPFFAVELARAMDGHGPTDDVELPASLADLVRERLDRLAPGSREVLLAAAAIGTPTVDVLARVSDRSVDDVVDLLEAPENDGVILIDGNRVKFTHPLLAQGVYTMVSPAGRRTMHRTLADVVDDPEARARHLALGSTTADADILAALDAASAAARARGAPAAAAELIELAITLGGDDPERRIRAAEHHSRAGDNDRAYKLLEPVLAGLPPGTLRAGAANLLASIRIYDDSFVDAIECLEQARVDGADDPELTINTLLLLSFAHFHAGNFDASIACVGEARTLVGDLDASSLVSQVLAMSVLANFLCGNGVDEDDLSRALVLEDRDAVIPFQLRATAVDMIVKGYLGRLDEARAGAARLRRLCLERGAEADLAVIASHCALIDVWRGAFADADVLATETVERARLIGGDHLLVDALLARTTVDAHLGRVAQARASAAEAVDAAMRSGSPQLAAWPMMVVAFLEVSLGNYEEALEALGPFVDGFDSLPGGETVTMWYLPDAVEALIGLGRADHAVALIEALESNGRRLGRDWLLATGARCRAMWLASHRDLPGALRSAHEAMAHHDRLPMPFERARTQLVLGRLQRRQRQSGAARDTLTEALREFERMGAEAWANRARAALANGATPGPAHGLSPSEQRVAELAANGMSNRDLAQALSISLKTVEANLTQIYRKLGIRSRAQLAQRIGSPPP